MSKKFLSGINVTGTATLNTVADAGSNTDKFLVLDSSNNVSYRTAAELYADLGIGSLPAGYTSTLKHEVKAGQTISKGQAVYVSSADGTNMIVTKASNVSEATSSKTMGLLEVSLSTNGKGNVITEGLLSGLNTNGATAGDPVWLGVDGALIFGLTNKPYAPAHLVFIGIVTRANANNGEIFVKVQNGFEMNELHNYQEGSVQNNQVIVYESATSLYKPKSISTILGFTPSDDSLVVKLAGAQVITGAKSFDAAITVNAGIGFLNGVMPNITSNLYSGIGGNSQGISIVTRPVSTNYTNNLYFATSNNSFTFPNATGTIALTSDLTAYVPSSRTITINGTTYDLSSNRSWTVSANQNARTEYEFTTNGSTATYTATYSVGQVDVFYNGSKLSSAEFTATNGTSVTLAFTPPTGQMVEIVAWETGGGVANGRTLTINGTSYDLSADRSWTVTDSSKLPLSGGTLTGALNGTSALFTDNLRTDTGLGLKYGSFVSTSGYLNLFSALVGSTYTLNLKNGTSGYETSLSFNNTANRNYIFPNADGTIALTSNLSSYLPLAGGTLTGALNGTSSSFNSLTAIFNAGSGTGSLGIAKWVTQPETNAITRTYFTGSDASTYGRWEIYRSTSTTPTIIHQYNSDGTQQMYGALSGTSATFSGNVTALSITAGSTSSTNTVLNANQLAAFNVTTPSTLYLNFTGGDIDFAGTKAIIKANGNVGIGTSSPSNLLSVRGNADFGATGFSNPIQSQYGALTFPRGQIFFSNTNSQNQLYIVTNAYSNASGIFAYRNSSQPATAIALDGGSISFLVAGNGTADATIPWTSAIGITNSGRVSFPAATAQNYGISNSTAITVSSGSATIASCSIVSVGKPILVTLTGDINPIGGPSWCYIYIYRNGSPIGKYIIAESPANSTNIPFALSTIDIPGSGTHTYTGYVSIGGANPIQFGETGNGQAPTILAIELL